MPTEINGYSPSQETPLSSLIINEVDSTETFKKMKEKNLLQDNQLYLVTDEQDPMVIDEVPTEGSKNLVYSGGVWTAIQEDSKVLQSHIKNTSNPHGVTAKQVGLGNVGNFKAVSTVASQGLTDTEKSNARANIGAGTSSLTIGTTASTAAAGNHTHTAANVGAVPTSRTVNGKALSANITLAASDIGAYSKSEADNLLKNKAPAGFGLGTVAASVSSGKDLNDIWDCGFYSWDNGVSNAPFSWGLMVVLSPGAFLNGRVQIAYDRVNKTIAIRWLDTTWSPWEYQNPPMKIGKEYRTTERWHGSPVYAQLFDCSPLPNATTKVFPVEGTYAGNVNAVVDYGGMSTYYGQSFQSNAFVTLHVTQSKISITSQSDCSAGNAYVWVKYTKRE